MAGEVIVDALPYIDQGYDEPGVREAVGTNFIKIIFIFLFINLLANFNLTVFFVGVCNGRGGMQEVPTYKKLFGNSTTVKRDSFRNPDDAHGV